MINDIKKEYAALMKAKKEVERLQKVISDKLETVREEKGKSFRQGSKYYQIRCRGGLSYIASSDKPFASWLKKGKTNEIQS